MSFVLVTADFPEITPGEFDIIFARLEKENWIKLSGEARPVGTIWLNPAAPEKPEEAIKSARHNFTSCCIPYCIPRLALEWGDAGQPVAHCA